MNQELELAVRPEAIAPIALRQTDSQTDAQVVALWLHGRSEHTQEAYRHDVDRFSRMVSHKPLAHIRLEDLQDFLDGLTGADASRARAISAVKSLLAFAHKIGYLQFNVGAAVSAPKLRCRLAERILAEDLVQRMIALEPVVRNRTLLRTLYGAGLRVSEACQLSWRDLQPRIEGQGQLTIFGKGSKTRAIVLPASIWNDLLALRDGAGEDDPVFRSRSKGAHLNRSQILRIVRAAARRIGVTSNVSPHWLRHAHASHALDRGAPIHLVQATLGHASVATTGRYTHARPNESSCKYLAA